MLQIWEFFSQVVLAPDEVNREELAVSDANIAKKKAYETVRHAHLLICH